MASRATGRCAEEILPPLALCRSLFCCPVTDPCPPPPGTVVGVGGTLGGVEDGHGHAGAAGAPSPGRLQVGA